MLRLRKSSIKSSFSKMSLQDSVVISIAQFEIDYIKVYMANSYFSRSL